MPITKPIAKYNVDDGEDGYDVITVRDDGECFEEFRFYPDEKGLIIMVNTGDYDGPIINLNWDEWYKIIELIRESKIA